MYELGELDQKKLEYLRQNTFIGPIAAMKIANARRRAEKYTEWYNSREHEQLGVDYSDADELEYQIRFDAYQRGWEKLWKQYGDGIGLKEYAEDALDQAVKEEIVR